MLSEIDNSGKQSVTTQLENPGALTQCWSPRPFEVDAMPWTPGPMDASAMAHGHGRISHAMPWTYQPWTRQPWTHPQQHQVPWTHPQQHQVPWTHPQQHQQARSPHQPQILDIDAFVLQTMISGQAWKRQIEESNRRAAEAEKHLVEACHQIRKLENNLVRLSCCVGDRDFNSYEVNDLRGHMLPKLRYAQAMLRGQLEALDKAIYLETAVKCMQCETNNRSVTLSACNHFVLCGVCAITQRECPYCNTPVTNAYE